MYQELDEPGHVKTCLQGFRPGPAQTGLCSNRRCPKRLEISDVERKGITVKQLF